MLESRFKPLPKTIHLGWSFSRNSKFEVCKRQYYYHYYTNREISQWAKVDYLKRLTDIPLEIGNVTHKAIQQILLCFQNDLGEVTPQRVRDFVERYVEGKTKKLVFSPVYYKQREEIDFEVEIVEPVLGALAEFLQSPRFDWICEEALAYKKDWIVALPDPYDYGEFRLGGLKTLGVADAIFRVDNDLFIFDWKTGESGGYAQFEIQLMVYAAWAKYHLDTDLSNVTSHIVLLKPGFAEYSLKFKDYDIDTRLTDLVRNQQNEMFSFCADPDQNIPKPKEEFPMTPHEGLCKYCNFRELCDRQ